MLCYTGIGARKTPIDILSEFKKWGANLAPYLTLRSGGADGADTAFEVGCDSVNGEKEIYLPWKGFNNSDSPLYNIPIEAFEVAADIYGSSWRYAKPATKKFMARNMQQVMGFGLDSPSVFVFCWTPDGCTTKKARTKETGGTGQAIAYADELGIPVFNFYNNIYSELVNFFTDHAKEYGITDE